MMVMRMARVACAGRRGGSGSERGSSAVARGMGGRAASPLAGPESSRTRSGWRTREPCCCHAHASEAKTAGGEQEMAPPKTPHPNPQRQRQARTQVLVVARGPKRLYQGVSGWRAVELSRLVRSGWCGLVSRTRAIWWTTRIACCTRFVDRGSSGRARHQLWTVPPRQIRGPVGDTGHAPGPIPRNTRDSFGCPVAQDAACGAL